ncbi:MAG: hypothetical protein QM504_06725 [Pseudomonadota bacterium]
MLNIISKTPKQLKSRFELLKNSNINNIESVIDVVSKKGDFYDNIFLALLHPEKNITSLVSNINNTDHPVFVIDFLNHIKERMVQFENKHDDNLSYILSSKNDFLLSALAEKTPFSAAFVASDEDVAFHKDFLLSISNANILLTEIIQQQSIMLYGTSNELLDFSKNAQYVDLMSIQDELMSKVFLDVESRDDLVEFSKISGVDILDIQNTLLRIPYDGDYNHLTELAQVPGTNTWAIAKHIVENGTPSDVNNYIISNFQDLEYISKKVYEQVNEPGLLSVSVVDAWMRDEDTSILLSNIEHLLTHNVSSKNKDHFKFGVELLSTERQSTLIKRYSNISHKEFTAIKQVVEAHGDYFEHMFLMMLNPKEDINSLMQCVMSKTNIDFCFDTFSKLNNSIEQRIHNKSDSKSLCSPFVKHSEFYNEDEDALSYSILLDALEPHKDVMLYFEHQAKTEQTTIQFKLASAPKLVVMKATLNDANMLPIADNDLVLLNNNMEKEQLISFQHKTDREHTPH